MVRMNLKETMDRLLLLIRSGYPVIYIQSHEEARVLDYLARAVAVIRSESPHKTLLCWYMGTKLQELKVPETPAGTENPNWLEIPGLSARDLDHGGGENLELGELQRICTAQMNNAPKLANSLSVFFDLHPFLREEHPVMVRPLRNTADELRRYYDQHRTDPDRPYKTIVIVAPTAAYLSMELSRDVFVIDFPLPETAELKAAVLGMVSRGVLKFPDRIGPEEIQKVCDRQATREEYQEMLIEQIAGAGRGLTLEDFKLGLNGFAVRGDCLNSEHMEDMLDLKSKVINNEPALEYTPHVEIKLGGLNAIKEWVRARRQSARGESVREKYHLPAPKGVMLCGVSGGGKSQLARLIANEFNLALLRLDIGSLFGMYIGQSEEQTRRALKLAEVLAPLVLWLDEIDKAFAAAGSGGDSGVSDRVFGTFLTWLAEKQDSVFVVATCNNFTTLLKRYPEFGRKGRFDEIFWVDLPTPEATREIYRIYLKPFVDNHYLPLDGEEVLALARECRLANLDLNQAPLDLLCSVLAHPGVSVNMTGAEIEHAIGEALYLTYTRSCQGSGPDHLTGRVILEAVREASKRALYQDGSEDRKSYMDDLKAAHGKRLLNAEGSGVPLPAHD